MSPGSRHAGRVPVRAPAPGTPVIGPRLAATVADAAGDRVAVAP